MGKCLHHYLLLNVLLTCYTVALSVAADGSGCSDLCTCFGDYDPNATSCGASREQQSQNSNTNLFIETESKVLCGGTLSRLQVHFYTQLTGVQEEDGDRKRVSRSRDRNCNWNAEFGLFRRNMGTNEFLLVEGSSSSPQSNITSSTSCQIFSMDFSYPDPRPTVKAGDHFVVLIRMRDSGRPCVVQPFPLSFSAGNLNQAFDKLSNVRFNSSAVEDMGPESISFDARIQLTDPGNCTSECCTPSQRDICSLCPAPISIDLRPTPSTTILSVSTSLDHVALNAGPTIGVPVAAVPFLALGPVIIALTIPFFVYLVWKRKNRRQLKRSLGSNRASNSSVSARNLSCSVAANIDSYRDPSDAVVIMETSNHTHTGCTTTIKNYLTADFTGDYSVEEDPYQDPDSLQDTNNKTVQPTFGDVVTNHSYALLHQSPQCTRQQQHKSRSAGDTEPGAWQYTTPARSEDELISQLKELTVREISLDHIETLDERLGIGEFGVVRRGVWSVGGEEREVAVKSLVDGSTEEKRIQFLQEAAIMGQFKHPSIISLHGIRASVDTLKMCGYLS
ncbi:Ephrin type-B receptor 1 [Geodia barretti]|uniref:Ephrin type-B receptor 1 n=1 Tax=Geodia barretti TaxID=519541 RepID=A0AA35R5R8_GEOBA|nr:Ephrin type-B receptor 1 [Geodia barretti]